MLIMLPTDEGTHVTREDQDTRVRRQMTEPGDNFAGGEGVFSI